LLANAPQQTREEISAVAAKRPPLPVQRLMNRLV